MDEVWLIVISVSAGGAFALMGGYLNHYLSTSTSKKKKILDLIDDFITSCFDYMEDLHRLFECFEECFEGLKKVQSKELDKTCEEYCKKLTDKKCIFDKSWKKFSLNFARTRIVLKDVTIKTKLIEIKAFQKEFDKYLDSTDEPIDLKKLHKDKKLLDESIKDINKLKKQYIEYVRDLHRYIMEIKV